MKKQLSDFIAAQILKDPTRSLSDDEVLISSGLIDSFSLVDLALFVEDTFGVRIEDSELTSDVFDTLFELTALVEKRRVA
jgi:acyl carrier protein